MSDTPAGGRDEEAEMPYDPDDAEFAQDVLEAAEARFLAIDGVTGIGLGQTGPGDDALTVYVRGPDVARRLPKRFEGLPVVVVVTGDIVAD